MRIDKLLWYLRLAKTRSIAQAMAEEGHIRLNGRRIDRSHQKVAAGDVLTLALGNSVRAIALLALPNRRGPAAEAQSCYRVLDGNADFPLAAPNFNLPDSNLNFEGDLQP
jgi:ribosome-associated heat shock protein Hsp15